MAESHNAYMIITHECTDNSPTVSIPIPINHGADAKVIPAPEYEDTAELLPPPLPPKNIGTQ